MTSSTIQYEAGSSTDFDSKAHIPNHQTVNANGAVTSYDD